MIHLNLYFSRQNPFSIITSNRLTAVILSIIFYGHGWGFHCLSMRYQWKENIDICMHYPQGFSIYYQGYGLWQCISERCETFSHHAINENSLEILHTQFCAFMFNLSDMSWKLFELAMYHENSSFLFGRYSWYPSFGLNMASFIQEVNKSFKLVQAHVGCKYSHPPLKASWISLQCSPLPLAADVVLSADKHPPENTEGHTLNIIFENFSVITCNTAYY